MDDDFKDQMPEKNDSNDILKEIEYCRELQKRIESGETLSKIPAVQEKLNQLKIHRRITLYQKIWMPGSDTKQLTVVFFGYKIHLAMTEERIITTAIVTSAEKGDGPELPKL